MIIVIFIHVKTSNLTQLDTINLFFFFRLFSSNQPVRLKLSNLKRFNHNFYSYSRLYLRKYFLSFELLICIQKNSRTFFVKISENIIFTQIIHNIFSKIFQLVNALLCHKAPVSENQVLPSRYRTVEVQHWFIRWISWKHLVLYIVIVFLRILTKLSLN